MKKNNSTAVAEAAPPTTGTYREVPIEDIKVDVGFNNRRELGDLAELAESIKSVGLLQPLTVYGVGPMEVHVIAGHRRLAAAELAGLKLVGCIVQDLDESGRLEALLVENLHRKDIDPLEEADGYSRLVGLGLSQHQVAAKVGRSQAHVSKRLALLKLPADAHTYIASGHLTLEDAAKLAAVDDAELVELAIEDLKASAKKGWAWDGRNLSQIKQQLETARKLRATIEKLQADKVSILKEEPGYGSHAVVRLGTGYGCLPMTPKDHAAHPCHAAYVERWSGEPHFCCTKPANHAKAEDKKVVTAVKAMESGRRGYSADGADEAKKKAAETRQRNKDLRARQPIREEALKASLAKSRDILDFTLRQLLQTSIDHAGAAADMAGDLLGIPEDSRTGRPKWGPWLAEVKGSDRLLKLAYAMALAMGEHPLSLLPKRGHFDQEFTTHHGRYLEHLKAAGYVPIRVERDIAKKGSNGYGWHAAFDKGSDAEDPSAADILGEDDIPGESTELEPLPDGAEKLPPGDDTEKVYQPLPTDVRPSETASERMERERRVRVDAAKAAMEPEAILAREG